MANLNGLISSRDVSATGAVASNFFVRKGDPIVSPLAIKSPDGTKTGIIAQNNNGNMVMFSDSVGDLFLGFGGVFFDSPNGSVNAQLNVQNNGDVALSQPSGGTLSLGGASGRVSLASLDASPVVQIGTDNGTVYDTVYTKPFTVTVLQIVPTVANIVYDETASVAAGLYQLQLTVETLTTSGSASNFLEFACAAPPSTDVINFSSTQIAPSAVGATLCLNSGYFTHAGGSLRVLMNSTTTPWTGAWTLQLVKLG